MAKLVAILFTSCPFEKFLCAVLEENIPCSECARLIMVDAQETLAPERLEVDWAGQRGTIANAPAGRCSRLPSCDEEEADAAGKLTRHDEGGGALDPAPLADRAAEVSHRMLQERRPSEGSDVDPVAKAGSLRVGLSVTRASVSRLM
jgi:hypothetical protein